MTSGPVILYATFTAHEDHIETVAALLVDYAASVRQESGNVLFEASRHADVPDVFFVYEHYRDQAAFQAHLEAAYGASFNAALIPLIIEPEPRLTFLQRI